MTIGQYSIKNNQDRIEILEKKLKQQKETNAKLTLRHKFNARPNLATLEDTERKSPRMKRAVEFYQRHRRPGELQDKAYTQLDRLRRKNHNSTWFNFQKASHQKASQKVSHQQLRRLIDVLPINANLNNSRCGP